MTTPDDLFNFLKENACRSETLKTWDEHAMWWWIRHSLREDSYTYYTSPDGKLEGLTLCKKDYVNRVMYVMMCVGISRIALQAMIYYFSQAYPGWKLVGRRHGQLRNFNVNKLTLWATQ